MLTRQKSVDLLEGMSLTFVEQYGMWNARCVLYNYQILWI